MKQFLKYVLFIFVIVFAMMYVLDKFYSYAFQNGLPRNKVQKMLQLQDAHYKYAFFGSSRTENHIDCELIEKLTGESCINFGISGGSIGDALILLTIAESNGVTFDHVFLQVDYNFNHHGVTKNFRANLIPFIGKPEVKKELKNDKNNFLYTYIPFYRYMRNDKVVGFRESLSAFLNKKPKTDLGIEFAPKHGIGLKVGGVLPDKYNLKNVELDKIVELSENNGFNLGFFTAPYCENIRNRDKLSELKKRIPSLNNYAEIFDDKPEYYFNCGHLNIEGARVFTRLFTEDILK